MSSISPHKAALQITRFHIGLVAVTAGLFSTIYIALQCWLALGVAGLTMLFTIGLLVFRVPDERLAGLSAGWITVATIAIVGVLGGADGPHAAWALAGPLSAVLLLGRLPLVWFSVTFLGFVVMNAIEIAGYPMPYDVPVWFRPAFERISGMAILSFVLLFLYGYLVYFERQQKALIQEVKIRRKAEAAAQSADRLKSSFLANMSHELRTPMNGVLGMAQLLQASQLPETQRRYVELIETSGRNLMTMLNEILDFSKIESDHLELELGPVALLSLAEEVAALTAGQAYQKGLRLYAILDPAADRPLVGDPNRIRQILINLLSNAIKFTETGRIVLRVFSDGPWLRASVKDTGIGMTEAQTERIFEPFQQAEVSTTRRFGGTGLGLSIARQLAEQMGGHIDVASMPGRGSTFTLSLPATGAASSPQPRKDAGVIALITDDPLLDAAVRPWLEHWGATVTDRPEGARLVFRDGESSVGEVALLDFTTAAQREGVMAIPLQHGELEAACFGQLADPVEQSGQNWAEMRALVVDDNAINQMVARELLSRLLGFNVEVADSGLAALEATSRADYDIVFMDCHMPGMDGQETTRQMRAQGYTGPIVALTANAFARDRAEALASGMDAYIAKPIDAAQVRTVLCELPGFRPQTKPDALTG